jgi:hypothetical protein
VLGVAILAKYIECVNLKYGNTAHALYAKTLPLLQATKRALRSAAALPRRCTACAAATRAHPQRARATAFLENAHFQFKNIFANFVSGTFRSARVLKLAMCPIFCDPSRNLFQTRCYSSGVAHCRDRVMATQVALPNERVKFKNLLEDFVLALGTALNP